MTVDPAAVDQVTQRLVRAAKYRDVHAQTIADVVAHQSGLAGDVADLERRARARLHKVAALHLLTARPSALRRTVDQIDQQDSHERRGWCRAVLAGHISAAERLDDLERFYPTVLGMLAPARPAPRTIVDVACALNAFTVPWLRDVSDARYQGYDFNATFVALSNAFLQRHYPESTVVHEDVLAVDSAIEADLVLLLKTFHCMEDRQPGVGLRLVETIRASQVVVSFPTRAMNGRTAVFTARHIDNLIDLAGRRGWSWSRAALPTEEFVALDKTGTGEA